MSFRSKLQDFVHPEWHPSRGDAAIALGSMIGGPLLLGLLNGILLRKDIKSWYKNTKKPSWALPLRAFGPVWAVLYVLLGFSSWSVWTHGGTEKQKIPLGFYGATLLLSLLWTPLTFKAKKFDLALITVVLQLGLLSSTLVAFHHAEVLASLTLVPAWLVTAFAVFQSFAVFRLNAQKSRRALHGIFSGIEKLTNNKGQ